MDHRILEEYQKELSKNKIDLSKSKEEIISQIKGWNKEEIFDLKKEKISIWSRIRKVLGF